jgi:hypothetical protein
MAKKAGFVKVIAEATGVPSATVMLVFRELNEAALTTKTGARGISAPDLVPLDAARMVIALLSVDRPMLAVSAVRDFGSLPLTGSRKLKPAPSQALINLDLTEGTTFEAAISKVIEILAASAFATSWREPFLTVSVTPNDMAATIECEGTAYKFSNAAYWNEWLGAENRKVTREGSLTIEAERRHAYEAKRSFYTYRQRRRSVHSYSVDTFLEIATMFRGSTDGGGSDAPA